MKGAQFCGDAERECQTGQDQWQRYRLCQHKLHDEATASEQRCTDDQAFEKAFVRSIKPGNVAAGGNEREKQAQMQLPDEQADGHGQTEHQRLT
ncbi:hypothetical protein TUM17580_24380 [Citrobacter farmeri]|nr:hypothetical protein TUM17580_24380 [Citrobacter farmeri]